MRHILLCIIICIFIACNDNTSENQGIKIGEVIVTSNGEQTGKNQFTYGETINLNFKNVSGLTKFEGKFFPKATIYLLNENKDTVEQTNYNFGEQFVSDKALNLEINLLAVLSDATNKKLELKVKIEDTKGEAAFNYAMPFSIVPNNKFLIKENGISYSNIYLLDKNTEGVITDNIITARNNLVIMYEGLQGFDIDNIGYINPAASAKIVDADGAVLLDEKNLLKINEVLGFKNLEAANSFPVTIFFDDIKPKNPVKLSVELYDLKSSNKLELETTLTIK